MEEREEFSISTAELDVLREVAGQAMAAFRTGVESAVGHEVEQDLWVSRFKKLAEFSVKHIETHGDLARFPEFMFCQGYVAGSGEKGASLREAFEALIAHCKRMGDPVPENPYLDDDPGNTDIFRLNFDLLDRPEIDRDGMARTFHKYVKDGTFDADEAAVFKELLELTDPFGHIGDGPLRSFKHFVKLLVKRTSVPRAKVERLLNFLITQKIIALKSGYVGAGSA